MNANKLEPNEAMFAGHFDACNFNAYADAKSLVTKVMFMRSLNQNYIPSLYRNDILNKIFVILFY